MKLNELLIVVMLWIASIIGTAWGATKYQRALDEASELKIGSTIEETRKAANLGAADAISKIVVRNTTVQGKVETIIRDNPVYRDCVHAPEQLRNINEALTGRAGSTGGGSLSRADSAQ